MWLHVCLEREVLDITSTEIKNMEEKARFPVEDVGRMGSGVKHTVIQVLVISIHDYTALHI